MAPRPLTPTSAPPSRSAPRTLTDVRAKSAPEHDPERLTTHSRIVHDTVTQIEERIATAGPLATQPAFWTRVRAAALLHDTGKVAEGFQQQLLPKGTLWGQRHEVLSLAYVDILAARTDWSAEDRLIIATLVATHHRALHTAHSSARKGKQSISQLYNSRTRWDEAFTRTPSPTGDPQIQVTRGLHRELLAWLCGALRLDPPTATDSGLTLADHARTLLDQLLTAWRQPVTDRKSVV